MTITPEQIKAARKLLGWSQATLAGRVHMSAARIWAIETGKHQPSAFELDLVREAVESAGVEFITRRQGGREAEEGREVTRILRSCRSVQP
jgi:transcriptional regulator with XRE-family HTH domain